MDPSSALSQALGPAILAALQARLPEDQVQVLLAQLGQQLDLTLFDAMGTTLKLQLPSGQVFEAEGSLPYPLGTKLTVQVQAPATDGGAPRLKLLQALPPSAPPILAPLLQGEAAPLMARLTQTEVPPELRPLLQLLEALQDPAAPQAPPASRILGLLQTLPEPAVQALRQLLPTAPPTLPELAQVLRSWIGQALEELDGPATQAAAPEAAGPTAASTPAPAPAPAGPGTVTVPPGRRRPRPGAPWPDGPRASAWLPGNRPALAPGARSPGSPLPAPPAAPPAPPGTATAAAPNTLPTLPAALPGPPPAPGLPAPLPPQAKAAADLPEPPRVAKDLAGSLLLRLEAQLATRGEPAPEARDPLRALLRQLFPNLEAPARAQPASPQVPNPIPHQAEALPQGVPRPSERAPNPAARSLAPPAPPELPQSWQAWIGSAMKVLGDPQVSPREAPFHLAQAREGTAFFELPLPWSAQPLQLWIESGAGEGGDGPAQEGSQRVMVGLSFSVLGETRIGLQKSRGALQVRIWTERPELLKDRLAELREGLEEEGAAVDLRLLPLGDPASAPSLRSIALGTGYQALG